MSVDLKFNCKIMFLHNYKESITFLAIIDFEFLLDKVYP